MFSEWWGGRQCELLFYAYFFSSEKLKRKTTRKRWIIIRTFDDVNLRLGWNGNRGEGTTCSVGQSRGEGGSDALRELMRYSEEGRRRERMWEDTVWYCCFPLEAGRHWGVEQTNEEADSIMRLLFCPSTPTRSKQHWQRDMGVCCNLSAVSGQRRRRRIGLPKILLEFI